MLAPPWLPIPPQGYGGIENVIDALVPELIKLGVEVDLYTAGDTACQATKIFSLYNDAQYKHIHLPQYESLPISIAHLLYAINMIQKDGNYDIIHDHNGFLGPAVFSYSTTDLPPVIHTIHGPPFMSGKRLRNGVPDNALMWEQFKDTKRFYVVGISNALMRYAPKRLKSITLPPVYNAVDLNKFPFEAKKNGHFITLARFNPDKGQSIAIRACLELGYQLKMAGTVSDIRTNKKVMLELANPLSPYRNLLDFRYFSDQIFPHLLEDQIEYVGEVGGQRKLQFIGKAKALLFPIQWEEPFGMSVIESLACGTPVIAMAKGAMNEIIEHGVNGFLAKNYEEFKYYIDKVDEIDPAACRESVRKRFSATTMAQEYLKRYQRVIQLNQSI